MKILLIAALCCMVLPALAGPTGLDTLDNQVSNATGNQADYQSKYLDEAGPAQSTVNNGYLEIFIPGRRVDVQQVFDPHPLSAKEQKAVDDYIAARRKWLSSENEKALRQFFSWGLPLGYVTLPLNKSAWGHYFPIQQTVEQSLTRIQKYVNLPDILIRIPIQQLPELGPLDEPEEIQEICFAKVGGAARCQEGCELADVCMPEMPACNNAEAAPAEKPAGLVNPGLQLPSTTKTRETATSVVVWGWDKSSHRFRQIQIEKKPKPEGDDYCPPADDNPPHPAHGGV